MPDQHRGGKKAKSIRQDADFKLKVTDTLPYEIYITHSDGRIAYSAAFDLCIHCSFWLPSHRLWITITDGRP